MIIKILFFTAVDSFIYAIPKVNNAIREHMFTRNDKRLNTWDTEGKSMLADLTTYDYLFLKYRSIHIKLEDIVTEYYPNLCRENMLAKARQQKFPFTCFRIDESQKGAFFVNIQEFAKVIDNIYSTQYSIFQNRTKKAIN